MKDLIVVGGGGFAKEIIWLANECGRTIKGLLDDDPSRLGKSVGAAKVIGAVSDWLSFSECEFVIAIGSPRTRYAVLNKMNKLGAPVFTTLIHPSVIKSDCAVIGKGSIICAGTIITVETKVGAHCILNLNVTVGHETILDDFVTIAPMVAVSGNVKAECFVEIGTGAVLKQGLTLCRGSMLGMGGVLTKNIPEFFIFAGNPAKKLKELPEI